MFHAASSLDPARAEPLQQALVESYVRFARLQRLFQQVTLVGIFHHVDAILPIRVASITALGYSRQVARLAPILGRRITYKHPVNGEGLTHTMEELLAAAVEEGVTLCKSIQRSLARGEPLLPNVSGPSLNVGLVGVPVRDCRFFHPFVEHEDYAAVLSFRAVREASGPQGKPSTTLD